MSKTSPRAIASVAAAVACLAAASPAAAAERSSSSTAEGHSTSSMSVKDRRITVDLTIDRFVVRNGRTYARGVAAARVLTRDGKVRRQSQRVLFAVKTTGSCRILSLTLEDLQLKLLGLHVNTSAINLRITGSRDAVLGRLFCRLANGLRLDRKALRASAARSLNRRLGKRPMRALRVRAAIAPKAQAAQSSSTGSCQVLELVLGPLNLDLLGLMVDLYGGDKDKPVVVQVTADPNGGVLGSLFCQLANSKASVSS